MATSGIGNLGAPLLAILFGIIVLLVGLGEKRGGPNRLLPAISIIGLVLAGIIAFTGAQTGEIAQHVFGGGMIADSRGGLFSLVLCIVAALAIGMAPDYLAEKGINQGEFYALILFSASGAMIMSLANDLVNVFVGLEVLSVALYILSGFARRERRSEESAVKYFLLGAFASGFLLYGTALIYGAVGLAAQASGVDASSPGSALSYTNFSSISAVLTASPALLVSPIFVAGVGLVIVGLGFKAAIVPFHSYAPDVYEGAPTPVTAFMSVAAKAGAFAALLRLFEAILVPGGTAAGTTGMLAAVAPYHSVLWGLAAATMIVGNVLAVRQTAIKRMLAYSSIAHAGYILVGVLASANGDASLMAQDAVRFYLFAYAFMNVGAFAVIVWLGRHGGEYLDIRDYAGLGRRNPLAAGVLTIFLLSLSGIPLTAGFLGKLYLFMAAIKAGETPLAVLGLVASAIGVFYYLNLIVQMFFRDPEHGFEAPRAGGAKWVAIICALGTLAFGIFPDQLLGPSVQAIKPEVQRGPSLRGTAVPADIPGEPGRGRGRGGVAPSTDSNAVPGADTSTPVPAAPDASVTPPAVESSPSPEPSSSPAAETGSPAPELKPETPSAVTAPASEVPARSAVPGPISTPIPASPAATH